MATTGTYEFLPSLGEAVLNAYARIGIRRAALTAEHMADARMEANLLQQQWNNKGVNLWTVDLITTALTQGVSTYNVPPETVMILDAYIRTNPGSGSEFDRTIMPFSRTDYASIANKSSQGAPTSFWFDRLIAPTITLWPVPDGGGPYTLKYYRYRVIQDAELTNGADIEIPVLWLDAFCAGLSHRLARIHAPQLETARKGDAVEAFIEASTQNVENVQINFTPMLSGYFR